MPQIYEYVRHPRFAELHAIKPIRSAHLRGIDHDNFFVRLNARVGLRITLIVGTMWCAYAFFALTLISLPSAIRSHDAITIVAWIAQTFLQLVLLPIIIVGQNIQAKAADRRAEDTFKDAEAVLKESEEIQKHLLAQDKALADIIERLEGVGGVRAAADA